MSAKVLALCLVLFVAATSVMHGEDDELVVETATPPIDWAIWSAIIQSWLNDAQVEQHRRCPANDITAVLLVVAAVFQVMLGFAIYQRNQHLVQADTTAIKLQRDKKCAEDELRQLKQRLEHACPRCSASVMHTWRDQTQEEEHQRLVQQLEHQLQQAVARQHTITTELDASRQQLANQADIYRCDKIAADWLFAAEKEQLVQQLQQAEEIVACAQRDKVQAEERVQQLVQQLQQAVASRRQLANQADIYRRDKSVADWLFAAEKEQLVQQLQQAEEIVARAQRDKIHAEEDHQQRVQQLEQQLQHADARQHTTTSELDASRRQLANQADIYRRDKSAADELFAAENEQLVQRLQLAEEAYAAEKEAITCKICLDHRVDRILTPCHHAFCSGCVTRLPDQTCPMCCQTISVSASLHLP